MIKKGEVPFLMACLAHNKLVEVRRAGLRSMMRAFPKVATAESGDRGKRAIPLEMIAPMMGCVDEDEVIELATALKMEVVVVIEGTAEERLGLVIGGTADFDDNRDAPPARRWKEIDEKMGGARYRDVIDGLVGTGQVAAAARVAPALGLNVQAPTYTPKAVKTATSQAQMGSTTPTSTPPSGSGFHFAPRPAPTSAAAVVPAPSSTQPAAIPTFTFTPVPAVAPLPGAQAISQVIPAAVVPKPPATLAPTIPAFKPVVPSPLASTSTVITPPKANTSPITHRTSDPVQEAQDDVASHHLAHRLVAEYLKKERTALAEAGYRDERHRREEAQEEEEAKTMAAAEKLLDQMIRMEVEQEGRVAFLEEMQYLNRLHRRFKLWQRRAKSSRMVRQYKEKNERRFKAKIESLNLGASMMRQSTFTDGGDGSSRGLSRSTRKKKHLRYGYAPETLAIDEAVQGLQTVRSSTLNDIVKG